jgi:hemerythrin-like domain-containing protein
VRDDRSDETDAFARLDRTHRRIEEWLHALEQAAADIANPERRFDALNDLLDAVRFLGRGAQRHHDDEEETLFPRLAAIAELAPLLAQLRAEHDQHDAAYADLRRLVDTWDVDEGPSAADEALLPALAQRLADIYRAHIAREEHELFPAARAALPPGAAEEMGREMIARRR